MSDAGSTGPESSRISLRDWILLPLLGVATVVLVATTMNLAAMHMFGKSATGVEKCIRITDRAIGTHGIPNSVCWDKGSETEPIEYRMNDCGYRMDQPCGPPQPGTDRIVMIGSSVTMGQWIPREQSLAGLLPQELSARRGRPVEVYNEGMMSLHPQVVARRADEIFGAQPNMVLWILTPYDIGIASVEIQNLSSPANPGGMRATLGNLKAAIANHRATSYITEKWQKYVRMFASSPVGVMLEHDLYLNESHYVESYLRSPDSESGFLRADMSQAWKNDLIAVDNDVAVLEEQARSAGVPMVVVLVPDRAEAVMISMGQWPTGYDPYKLGADLRSIVEKRGGVYVDVLPAFRALQNAGSYYFPVDGHPNIKGNKLLTSVIAQDLSNVQVTIPVATRTHQRGR